MECRRTASPRDAAVEPFRHQTRSRDQEQIERLIASGRVSCDIEQILPAAHEGRVKAIFVASDERLWGRFDASARRIVISKERTPGAEDLLDLAAVEALANGGGAYAVTAQAVPAGLLIAALYRYT
jgi:hypothetical protein